ncbi:hypothetical protein GCM10022247_46190 [Allokutzneria multivorans]|uniref:Subtilisin inhibitor domain-containing protein n=1 Tax=Allokutzneria multivorans TaxID=1142134 RepID=A0ABP7SWL3_9PSEU
MSWNRPLRFVPIAVTALLAALATPAGAILPPAPPAAALVLTSTPGEAPAPSARRVPLTCSPDGGGHPAPVASCAALARTGGSVAALHLDPGASCPLIYAPVTTTATGTWFGRRVREQITFPNRCVLIAKTGPLFRF